MNKFLVSCRYIALTCALLPIAISLSGQATQSSTQPVVKTVRYDYLQLKGDLPYQEVFYIRGFRNIFMGMADAATLTIVKGLRNAAGQIVKDPMSTPTEYFWWAKAAGDIEFEFYIDQSLEFNSEYVLTFNFYQATSSSTDLQNKVKQKLLPVLENFYSKKNTIGADDVRTETTALLTQIISESTGTGNKIGMLTAQGGIITFVPQKDPQISGVPFNLIAELVNKHAILRLKEGALSDTKEDIREFSLDWDSVAVYNTGYFKSDEIDEMRNFIEDFTPMSQVVKSKIVTARNAAENDLTKGLQELRSLSNTYEDRSNEIAQRTTEMNALKQTYESTFQLVFEKIYSTLGSGIQVNSKSEGVTLANVTNTRFGIVVGAGSAFLNAHLFGEHGPVEAQPFAYLGVKYYFRAVDKRVNDPYIEKKPFKKWSAIAGWKIAGDLTFQGRALSDVIGMTPVAGLSWDATRFISIDFLGIFYKHGSVNPLDTNSTLGVSPCITISADVDLVNRLRQLLSNSPYTPVQPKSK